MRCIINYKFNDLQTEKDKLLFTQLGLQGKVSECVVYLCYMYILGVLSRINETK